MIRTVWTGLVALGMTLLLAPPILFNAMLRRKDGDWYVDMTRLWARTVMRASGCPVVVHGRENVRLGEPQVIVSNHVSWFDVLAIASELEVPYHFVAKKELLAVPLFGPAMVAAGHIAIDRSNRERAVQSLREAGERIRHTPAAVVIFAEGTRSRSGRLQPFKKGAFLLAMESRVALVPTAVKGSWDIMPSGSWRIRPHPVHVHFLPPIPPAEVAALARGGAEPLMNRVRHDMLTVLAPYEATLPPPKPAA